MILQIQYNGNDLEEEGGEYFVDRYAALRVGSQRASATVATTDGRYSGHGVCCDGCCDCSYDSTTKARPPEGLKGQRAQEEEAEGYWWW